MAHVCRELCHILGFQDVLGSTFLKDDTSQLFPNGTSCQTTVSILFVL